MGNFDVTTPVGSDLLSQGDDKIREFKNAMREALRAGEVAGDNIEGVEAIFPGASPSTAPVYRYRGLKGTTAERPTAGQYGLYFDTTRNVLQRDNGTSWEDIGQVVLDGSITEAKLSASVAGDGLSGGANTPLAVNVGAGLEISSDTVKLATGIDGAGLLLTGSVLSVNVDNSTIEINSDALRVKDSGIARSKLIKVTTSLSNVVMTSEEYAFREIDGFVLRVSCTWSSSSTVGVGHTNISTSVARSASNPSISSSGSLDTSAFKSTITFYSYPGPTTTFSNISVEYFQFPL